MKKRFAIFFMLIHLFMAWEQEAIAVENISIESINLYQVYIRIKEGCTELSKSDLLEMDQYEEAIIYVPDSFSQIDVLYNRLNATDFDVSATPVSYTHLFTFSNNVLAAFFSIPILSRSSLVANRSSPTICFSGKSDVSCEKWSQSSSWKASSM